MNCFFSRWNESDEIDRGIEWKEASFIESLIEKIFCTRIIIIFEIFEIFDEMQKNRIRFKIFRIFDRNDGKKFFKVKVFFCIAVMEKIFLWKQLLCLKFFINSTRYEELDSNSKYFESSIEKKAQFCHCIFVLQNNLWNFSFQSFKLSKKSISHPILSRISRKKNPKIPHNFRLCNFW